jgi:hypothetical protein
MVSFAEFIDLAPVWLRVITVLSHYALSSGECQVLFTDLFHAGQLENALLTGWRKLIFIPHLSH